MPFDHWLLSLAIPSQEFPTREILGTKNYDLTHPRDLYINNSKFQALRGKEISEQRDPTEPKFHRR